MSTLPFCIRFISTLEEWKVAIVFGTGWLLWINVKMSKYWLTVSKPAFISFVPEIYVKS